MPDDAPEVSVIVVSYNTRDMTLRCLDAVFTEIGSLSAEVIVVDNASSDDSAEAIRQRFPDARVIVTENNLGFARGNNVGMSQARGRYFLLINSDAFVQSGSIGEMMGYLNSHPEMALVGPMLMNADGTLQRSCYRYPTPGRAWAENLWISAAFGLEHALGDYRKWPHDQTREVDWVIGACLMVRREVYRQIGGFDERFFMYAEETDWQLRMRKAGWKIGFTPAARVIHLGGISGKGEQKLINRHFFDSLDRYELKHHGYFGLFLLRLAMCVGSSAVDQLVGTGGPVEKPTIAGHPENQTAFLVDCSPGT